MEKTLKIIESKTSGSSFMKTGLYEGSSGLSKVTNLFAN